MSAAAALTHINDWGDNYIMNKHKYVPATMTKKTNQYLRVVWLYLLIHYIKVDVILTSILNDRLED